MREPFTEGRIASAYIMLELEDGTTIETVILPGHRQVECGRDIAFHVNRYASGPLERARLAGLDKITMTVSGGDYRSVMRKPGASATQIEPLEIEGSVVESENWS